jgi:hypothetical protein
MTPKQPDRMTRGQRFTNTLLSHPTYMDRFCGCNQTEGKRRLGVAACKIVHCLGSGSKDAVSTLIEAASALATPFT